MAENRVDAAEGDTKAYSTSTESQGLITKMIKSTHLIEERIMEKSKSCYKVKRNVDAEGYFAGWPSNNYPGALS